MTRAQLVQHASRHRHRWEPPPTPPGFWDLGFMDSLVRDPARSLTSHGFLSALVPSSVIKHNVLVSLRLLGATCSSPSSVEAGTVSTAHALSMMCMSCYDANWHARVCWRRAETHCMLAFSQDSRVQDQRARCAREAQRDAEVAMQSSGKGEAAAKDAGERA